ncbi:YveK family protein [Geodermatophilus nigrescens]|uniref:Capsular polysaccharide biosynthesis protein n=1 Tax=Geodermatophilus nigrescens TaxID=1070870 RepID=A0A1M5E3Q7_9ACTN|nr:Wzz/FepE/Etk N-terminal domain-containing protein [Geodermatophilus nigrescens]SHF73784.1 Capsular polysaccharide biosynthesis protein [Geodermatophilus nigrescens]
MELRDYLAALRGHWRTWVGVTVLGVLLATVVVAVTPRTYTASARVFVAVSPSIPNSGQFVAQRVKSYPDVVVSRSVLEPVIDDLELGLTVPELAARVEATNPADTSQVEISVSDRDPEAAAAIADAVAERVTDVVEDLETPSSGNRPVTLTVTDPAAVPTAPSSPAVTNILALGLLGGLFVGLALAVLRSRTDDRLLTAADVRAAWGGDGTEVLTGHRVRRAGALTARPADVLARRLRLAAEDAPVTAVLTSPGLPGVPAARALAGEVAALLTGRGTPTVVTGPGESRPADGARVHLEVADPRAPMRLWRRAADGRQPLVLVIPAGGTTAPELAEMRAILAAAGVTAPTLAVVPRTRTPRAAAPTDARPAVPAAPEAPATGQRQPAAAGSARPRR